MLVVRKATTGLWTVNVQLLLPLKDLLCALYLKELAVSPHGLPPTSWCPLLMHTTPDVVTFQNDVLWIEHDCLHEYSLCICCIQMGISLVHVSLPLLSSCLSCADIYVWITAIETAIRWNMSLHLWHSIP